MEWLILGSQCLVLIVLWGLLVVQNRDRLTREKARDEALDAADGQLATLIRQIHDRLDKLQIMSQKALEATKPDYGEFPPGTAFVPGEVGEKELERMILQSEDHSVGPGPTRFSSRPSDPSRPGSRREASTRAARRFGTG